MSKNTVTKEQIERIIEQSTFETFHRVHGKQCIVVAKLPNGFTVVGESACVDANNYDQLIGFDLAMKHIKNRLWELEGYALQNMLHEQSTPNETKLKSGVYTSIVNDSFAQPLLSNPIPLQQGHVRFSSNTYVGDASHDKTIEGAVDDVLKVWNALD